MISASDIDFERKVLKENGYILVYFWGKWCTKCKVLGPAIEGLKEKIKIAKFDVKDNYDIPKEYGIKELPAVIIFKDGKKIEQMEGKIYKEKLEERIDKLLI